MINNESALILFINSSNHSSSLEVSLRLSDSILFVFSLDLQPHLLYVFRTLSHLKHEIADFVPFFAGFEFFLNEHVFLENFVGLFGV